MATEPDDTANFIANSLKKALQTVQQRCAEALKALDRQDHVVALGALTGLEQQMGHITARLMILWEAKGMQKQKRERRNK